jgi:hypothetical protein
MVDHAAEHDLFDADDVDDSILHGAMPTYFERTSPEFRGRDTEDVPKSVILPPAAEK